MQCSWMNIRSPKWKQKYGCSFTPTFSLTSALSCVSYKMFLWCNSKIGNRTGRIPLVVSCVIVGVISDCECACGGASAWVFAANFWSSWWFGMSMAFSPSWLALLPGSALGVAGAEVVMFSRKGGQWTRQRQAIWSVALTCDAKFQAHHNTTHS